MQGGLRYDSQAGIVGANHGGKGESGGGLTTDLGGLGGDFCGGTKASGVVGKFGQRVLQEVRGAIPSASPVGFSTPATWTSAEVAAAR